MDAWWDKYIGIPYEHNGVFPESFDCYGLVRAIYQHERGIAVPDYSERSELPQAIVELASAHWVPVTSPQLMDVVLLTVAGIPAHCGIMLNNEKFIHILPKSWACVETVRSKKWERRVLGYYRWET